MQIPAYIADDLERLEATGRLRRLARYDKGLVDFSSNDYLGLAGWNKASAGDLPFGSGGSRLLCGHHAIHEQVEERLSDYFRAPSALLFGSGYHANMGLIQALGRRQDCFLYDEKVHASMREGLRLAMGPSFSFRHNDPSDLERKLQQRRGEECYVLVESLYSMDGDEAPICLFAELCETYGAWLIVDEAHSTGVCGPGGRGCIVATGLENRVLARVHTFGKALGAAGAAVLGSQLLTDFLINRCRSFIYTTSMPPVLAGRLLDVLDEGLLQPRVAALNEVIVRFQRKAAILFPGWATLPGPIQVFMLPGNEQVLSAAAALQKEGVDVRAVRAPTVSAGSERLRICLHAFNTEEETDLLLSLLKNLRVHG